MRTFLFVMTAVLWGSSAVITAGQAVSGAPEVSVGLRMAIVSVVMFGWSQLTGLDIILKREDLPWVGLQGVLFFGLSFIAFYHSTVLIPSGIAALILSTSSLFAAGTGWLFMSQRVSIRMLAGCCIGIAGLSIIAFPHLQSFSVHSRTLEGLLLGLTAAAATGAGTVVAVRNHRAGIPIPVLMSWAALFGTVFTIVIAVARHDSFHIEFTVGYLAGLAYLSLIASCITFFIYFYLVHHIGAAKASYTLALVPVVALLFSTLFENLTFTSELLFGGIVVLVGNFFVLSEPSQK